MESTILSDQFRFGQGVLDSVRLAGAHWRVRSVTVYGGVLLAGSSDDRSTSHGRLEQTEPEKQEPQAEDRQHPASEDK